MRFQVPQFIEVEDKLFGPLTFKQFIYIAGGVGICVIFFAFLPKFFAFILSIPVLVFVLALAFYKLNGKPFIQVVEAFLKYQIGSKLYLWKKEAKIPEKTTVREKAKPIEQVGVPKLSQSKLKELTWSLDVQETQVPTVEDSDSTTSN